jgi:hypothetical protein
MKEIGAECYLIRVEMHELWSSGEKLYLTSKKITFNMRRILWQKD